MAAQRQSLGSQFCCAVLFGILCAHSPSVSAGVCEESSGIERKVSLHDLASPVKNESVKVEGSPQGTPSKRLRTKTKVEDLVPGKSKGDRAEEIRVANET